MALILVLSCCPSVLASAEGTDRDGSSVSDMDPHIKEIIESQMTREEKDGFANTELADTLMIRIYYAPPFWSIKGNGPKEKISNMISGAIEAENNHYRKFDLKPTPYYYVLSDSLYEIQQLGKDEFRVRGEAEQYILDIVNMPAKVEINGKLSTVTNIYCFRYTTSHGVFDALVCILTESGALIKLYNIYSDNPAHIFTEGEFLKYGASYAEYVSTMAYDEYGFPIVGYTPPFLLFVNEYDEYMAEADEMNAKRRLVKIKQALATYGPIVLVVLVAGGGAAIYIICRKRKKKALAAESVPNPEDIPTPTEQVLDPTEPISDPTEQIPNTPDP